MKLILFYGDGCIECKKMEPIVKRLEKELKVKFVRKEIWHHPLNAKLMVSYGCKTLPMFLNQENGEFVCGPTTYNKLKAWLLKQTRLRKP